ncbi:MAG: hypothetical protein HPM95_15720 [Alphaproteobacteria bacterium]|nr:hypothetical protein [Alphaproteobacteria bacterium]
MLHDLRTPLSAMRTAVELIDLDPTTQRQASAIRTRKWRSTRFWR